PSAAPEQARIAAAAAVACVTDRGRTTGGPAGAARPTVADERASATAGAPVAGDRIAGPAGTTGAAVTEHPR
ncbi:hypothetical protein, partial [Mycobacterium kiyosense]|uniref:hypothetical protein n=1 Tax=Mycobacterium kiyosense TaxID=2871094 RepID=UPI00222F0FCC